MSRHVSAAWPQGQGLCLGQASCDTFFSVAVEAALLIRSIFKTLWACVAFPGELPWPALCSACSRPACLASAGELWALRLVGLSCGLWGWSSLCWVPRAMLVGGQVPEPEACGTTTTQSFSVACGRANIGAVRGSRSWMQLPVTGGQAPLPHLLPWFHGRAFLTSVSASWVLLAKAACGTASLLTHHCLLNSHLLDIVPVQSQWMTEAVFYQPAPAGHFIRSDEC